MTNEEIISELRSIEAFADELKRRCYTTRTKLERLNVPAPRRGLSEEEKAKLIANRHKNKKAPDVNRGNFLTTIK